MTEDIYQEVFSGFFHASFEISTFLLTQFVGCDLWITIAMRINEDKVSLFPFFSFPFLNVVEVSQDTSFHVITSENQPSGA